MKNGVARSNRPLTENTLQLRIFAHGVGQVAGHVGVAQWLRRPCPLRRLRGRTMGVVPHPG